ncbi:sporulation protein [Halobacillus massiliensis]|uniref:sporulation protein n=1 Tax=Halobacillus massiliensis TaxID=1926286 RepID=UPI0009E301E6|nr:sporulation protein [Halobacillus massiliensis]
MLLDFLRIGRPKIDLILDSQNPTGVKGTFSLYGGWTEHRIQRLECDLIKVSRGGKLEFVAPVVTRLMAQRIQPKEYIEVPFNYQLPTELPPLQKGEVYKLQTRLIVDKNMKCTDTDELAAVHPLF